MSEERNPVDQALDLFVYAPIGLALSAKDELPQLIAKGKQQVEGQLALAKMFGQFAVAQGQKEAEKLIQQAMDRLSPEPGPAPDSPTPRPQTRKPTEKSTPQRRDPQLRADGLAIPGYDSLSASQVVARLAGLSGSELTALKAYEEATRGRRTILNRVSQLQAGD